jgi:hypothetical protein
MNSIIHIEPMEEDEIAFIEKKYNQESKAYMYAMNRLLIIIAVIPFIIALIYYVATGNKQVLFKVYFIGLGALLCLFSLAAIMSYRHKLLKYKNDFTFKNKIVETVTIESVKYMSMNNTYHFYINSQFKYSIEVSESFFHQYQPGDEINIEYSVHAGEYFGYF